MSWKGNRAGGGSPEILQRGVTSFGTGNLLDVTINAVDLDEVKLEVAIRGDLSNADYRIANVPYVRFLNSTTIRIECGVGFGFDIYDIEWTVVKMPNVKSIQRGVHSNTTTPTTISSVDKAKSLLSQNTGSKFSSISGGATYEQLSEYVLHFTNGTTLTPSPELNTTQQGRIAWEVIEFN